MLDYSDVLDAVPNRANFSILLGNGFSRAWRDDVFSYETLLDTANLGRRSRIIKALFTALQTYDFELVTKHLQAAGQILRCYDDHTALQRQLQEDAQTVKDALLSAIAATHPARPNEITNEQYESVRTFLSTFARIYTVNYDLLLHWARNQVDLTPAVWDTDDGFRGRKLLWVEQDSQEIFFLHGALHLYQDRDGVRKHAFSRDRSAIVDTVRNKLASNVFPLFVSEPNSDAKLTRINANPYLKYCLRRLSAETGTLLIFGHQVSDVDQHIFDAVRSSRVRRIFVSIYGDPNSAANTRTRANTRAFLEKTGTELEFVDATSIPAWQD